MMPLNILTHRTSHRRSWEFPRFVSLVTSTNPKKCYRVNSGPNHQQPWMGKTVIRHVLLYVSIIHLEASPFSVVRHPHLTFESTNQLYLHRLSQPFAVAQRILWSICAGGVSSKQFT